MGTLKKGHTMEIHEREMKKKINSDCNYNITEHTDAHILHKHSC
jgi:hypothetical protein